MGIPGFDNQDILTCEDLASVPIVDCDQPLVSMGNIDVVTEVGIELYQLRSPRARVETVIRLTRAAGFLTAQNPAYGLRVLCAYRPLPAHEPRIATPDETGHATGGAFDVAITLHGGPVDMGSAYGDWASPHAATFTDEVQAARNHPKKTLRRVMMRAGFAPFNGVWWHFSYGDANWAAFFKRDHAIYKPV